MADWVVTGSTPLPQGPAPVQVPTAAPVSAAQWQVTGETPLSSDTQAVATVDAASHPIMSAADSAASTFLRYLGDPDNNYNLLGATNWAISHLGGKSQDQLKALQTADQTAHPDFATAGKVGGVGTSAILGSEGADALLGLKAAAPFADALDNAGAWGSAGRAAITNGAGGVVSNLNHPLAGAAIGAGMGAGFDALGSGYGALKNSFMGASDPVRVAEMSSADLIPTVAGTAKDTAGAPVGAVSKLSQALAGSRNKITAFAQKDLVRAALKPFGITDTTDLSNSTIARATNAAWQKTNQLMKDTTVPLTGPPASALVDASGNPISAATVSAPLQKQLTDIVPSLVSDPAARTTLLAKINSGSLSGTDALDLFRTTRNASARAGDPFSKQSLSDVAQQLRTAIGDANPDALSALDESNALHQKLLVLKDVAEKANAKPNGLPTLQDFAMSNKNYTPYGSVQGPYQGLVDASQNAYVAPAGSTGRYGGPLAALVSKAAPFVGGWAGEHLASALLGESPAASVLGMTLGAGGEHLAEGGLSKALANAALKDASQTASANRRSKLAAALNAALGGNVANAMNGQN